MSLALWEDAASLPHTTPSLFPGQCPSSRSWAYDVYFLYKLLEQTLSAFRGEHRRLDGPQLHSTKWKSGIKGKVREPLKQHLKNAN